MESHFDKVPSLSKLEKCCGLITIKCPPGMDTLKKTILKFKDLYIFYSFIMDEVHTLITMRSGHYQSHNILLNGKEMYLNIIDKEISLSEEPYQGITLKKLFHFYKGFTCPKDRYFIHPQGNYYVLEDDDEIERYIYTEEYPISKYFNNFNIHLEKYKADLMMNKYEKWYTWFNCEDIKEFEKYFNQEFILYDKKKKRAIIKKAIHFSNRYICLIPKVSNFTLLPKVVELLNSSEVSDIKNITLI